MAKIPPSYNSFPASVKNAILFLFIGWIWHFFFLYKLFGFDMPGKMVLQQLVIALLVCFFVVRIRNWARVLCMVCNCLVIVLYFFIAALYLSRDVNISILAVINIILFSISTYYFFLKSSSDFYKIHSPHIGDKKKGEE